MNKFEQVPVEQKLLMTILGLANQDVYRKIRNLFDITTGDAHFAQRRIMEVCTAVAKYLKSVYMKLKCLVNCKGKLSRNTIFLWYVAALMAHTSL